PALALAARALLRQLVEQRLDVDRGGGRAHPLSHLLLRYLLDAQAERDVLEHGHVREQREVLEDHAEPALAGLQIVDHGVADDDAAAGRPVEPGDLVQRGGLPAARRPHHDQKLAVADLQVDPVPRRVGAERLDQVFDHDASHVRVPLLRRHLRMVPKLKPLTRCFWIRMPSNTTGMVIMVPIAACGPYSRPSEALWNLLSSTVSVVTSGWVRVSASRNSGQFRMNTNRKVTTMPEATSGSTIRRMAVTRLAPIRRAACSSVSGNSSMKVSIIQIPKGSVVAV